MNETDTITIETKKVNFEYLFEMKNINGIEIIRTKRKIKISDTIIGEDSFFGAGDIILKNGKDFYDYKGKDLNIEEDNNITTIVGIYQ